MINNPEENVNISEEMDETAGAPENETGASGSKTGAPESETGAPKDGEGSGAADEAAQDSSDDAGASENDQGASAEDEALETKYLRLMADFQNYKRRTASEKENIYAYANEKIVSELLTVIDNFERALDHTETADDSFVQGMKMIYDQLIAVLDKSNVQEIKALGEDFDPNMHNAMLMADSDEYESGKVCEVLQKGYTLNGRVVRPAMVKVAN